MQINIAYFRNVVWRRLSALDKNKWDKDKIILTICIVVPVVSVLLHIVLPHGWFSMIINPPRFVEIELEKFAISYFEPSDETPEVRFRPHWYTINNQERADRLAARYALDLPEIDFEREMFVVALGSKIERLDYDENAPAGCMCRSGSWHTAFAFFVQDEPENVVVVYRTEKIDIMHSEITNYWGRRRTP